MTTINKIKAGKKLNASIPEGFIQFDRKNENHISMVRQAYFAWYTASEALAHLKDNKIITSINVMYNMYNILDVTKTPRFDRKALLDLAITAHTQK